MGCTTQRRPPVIGRLAFAIYRIDIKSEIVDKIFRYCHLDGQILVIAFERSHRLSGAMQGAGAELQPSGSEQREGSTVPIPATISRSGGDR